MVKLSFSTINSCLQPENSHAWINKMSGIEVPENVYMTEGKIAHSIIQKHVSNELKDTRLDNITMEFPLVERKDFDERLHFEFEFDSKKEKYLIHGYYDGLDLENGRFLEIKTSGTPWSIKKFQESFQRKLYTLSNEKFVEGAMITCKRDPEEWKIIKPQLFTIPCTQHDRDQANIWILAGVRILESGNYTGGLIDGKCDGHCLWGSNCSFYEN
jgi:hypothetical protein